MQKNKKDNLPDIFLISIALLIMFLFFYIEFNFYFNLKKDRGDLGKEMKLLLETDKDIYSADESVKIIIKNMSVSSFSETGGLSGIPIDSRKNLGNNYAIGLIEKNDDNKWVAVEPIWRCGGKCSEACNNNATLKAYESKIFIWDKKMVDCGDGSEKDPIIDAGNGIYRATIAAWNKDLNNFELIHSKSFSLNVE
jgi:hypothetical protein